MEKAIQVREIYQAFRATPLSKENLDHFYVDASEARGDAHPRKEMARLLRRSKEPQHILFMGHKGCGKSTELNHLQADLGTDFLVLNFSVVEELDVTQVSFIELVIVTMERLFDTVMRNGLEPVIPTHYLESLRSWGATKEIEEIKEKYNITVDGSIGAELSIPFWKAFFVKFKATAKTSGSLKELIRKNIEPRLSDLLQLCNGLIHEIKSNLGEINKKDMLLIIEDLDKMPLDQSQRLFYNHPHQLTQLKTHLIFTFPIAIYYSTQFASIKPYFSIIRELPMIKIAEKNGAPYLPGISTLREIVQSRMDLKLFEENSMLDQIIADSGGCLRDLFLMIYEAAEFALNQDRNILTENDRLRAEQKLKKDYDSSIAEFREGNIHITVEEFFNTLVELANNPLKKPDNTEVIMYLKQSLCVLSYNGEGWVDLHPLVRKILIERGKLPSNYDA